jgi:hypothetical protein
MATRVGGEPGGVDGELLDLLLISGFAGRGNCCGDDSPPRDL